MADAFTLTARLVVLDQAAFSASLNAAAGSVQNAAKQIEGAGKSVGTAGSAMQETEKKAGFLGDALKRVGDTALRLATYFVFSEAQQAVGEIAGAFIGLDREITNALSIQNGRADAFEGRMRSMARALSTELGIPVQEVAEAFYFLASAGLSVEEQLTAMPVATRFAKAGMIDLGQATETLAQAFAIFKPQGRSMAEIADLLAEAANESQGTIEGLAAALTNKAGTAAVTFGQSMEDTVAVLAAFADRGIKGKVAGEQFSILLRDMSIRATKNADAFEAMGIKVNDAQGNMLPIIDILTNMQRAFAGLSDAQTTQALLDLGFTLRSQNVIRAALASGDAFTVMRAKLEDFNGSVDRVVKVQLSSLAAQLDILKAKSIDLGISGIEKLIEAGLFLKDTFEPAIRALIPALAALVAGFGEVAVVAGTVAGATIVGGLKGIALALEAIGNFASQHQEAVRNLGVALAAYASIRGGVAVVEGFAAAFKTLAATNIGAFASLLTQVRSFGDLGSLLSAATVGVSGFVALLTGAAIFAAVDTFRRLRDEGREVKATMDLLKDGFERVNVPALQAGAAIQAFRDSLAGIKPATDTLAQAAEKSAANMVNTRLVTEGLAEAFSHIGVGVDDVAAAILTGTNSFDDLRANFTGLADEGEAVVQELERIRDTNPAGPVKDLAIAMLDAVNSGKLLPEQVRDLAKEFDRQADSADKLVEAQGKLAEKALTTALSQGEINLEFLKAHGVLDITEAKTQDLIAAYEAFNEINQVNNADEAKFANLPRITADGAAAVRDLGKDAEITAEKFEDLGKAIDEALDIFLTPIEGAVAMQQTFADVAEAFAEVDKDGKALGVSFDITTQRGRDLTGQVIGLVKGIRDYAEAVSGGDPQRFAKELIAGAEAATTFLTNLGLTREEAVALLEKLGLMEGVRTAEVEVTDEDTAAETQAKIDAVAEQERVAKIKADADLAQAQSDFAGMVNEPRSAHVVAEAETVEANRKINEAAANRMARIDLNLQAGTVPTDIDWIARQRQAGVTPVLDGWAAARTNDDANWLARARAAPYSSFIDAASAAFTEYWLNRLARNRQMTIEVTYWAANQPNPNGTANLASAAAGGVFEYYAAGGMRERHLAQIAPVGTHRIWNEPETGGEAYIPLALSKRARSLKIWEEVGRRLGMDMRSYAGGGGSGGGYSSMSVGGGGVVVNVMPGALSVAVDAMVGADPAHLAGLVQQQMGPALNDFASDIVGRMQRKKARS